jgi:hypothetical protein
MTVPSADRADAGLVSALVADIPGPVKRREYLRYRRDPSGSQATAANHQFVEPVQQSVVDIVLAVRGHAPTPRFRDHFLTVGMAKNQQLMP